MLVGYLALLLIVNFMKNIALITDIPFWRIGLGSNARILELCRFLSCRSHFTLYYLGSEPCPIPGPVFQEQGKRKQLETYLEKAKHDLIIAEYIHLHWIADIPLQGTAVYLDALDLFSERVKSFEAFNRKTSGTITYEEEIDHFRKFDRVMFLQKEEIEKVMPMLSEDRLLLCPHPVVPEAKIVIRQEIKAISFFGSPSWPNVDGIQWFHDKVMPLLGDWAQKCIVNGMMSASPLSIFTPSLARGKVFSSLKDYYQSIDVAINPVLYGSGLKIKTVEAIAYGVPLVSTSAGAQGLREESGRAYLLADTPEEFAKAILALAGSESLRRRLSRGARSYARKHLTPEACFGSILK